MIVFFFSFYKSWLQSASLVRPPPHKDNEQWANRLCKKINRSQFQFAHWCSGVCFQTSRLQPMKMPSGSQKTIRAFFFCKLQHKWPNYPSVCSPLLSPMLSWTFRVFGRRQNYYWSSWSSLTSVESTDEVRWRFFFLKIQLLVKWISHNMQPLIPLLQK